jgi:hypothetical protein
MWRNKNAHQAGKGEPEKRWSALVEATVASPSSSYQAAVLREREREREREHRKRCSSRIPAVASALGLSLPLRAARTVRAQ